MNTNTASNSIEMLVSKPMAELQTKIASVYAVATEEDKKKAGELARNGRMPAYEVITPAVAAVIITDHNKVNRGLTVSKVYGYVDIMKRGDWRHHHQGIAFYPDSSLADGQHRMNAVALSGLEQRFLVTNDFDKSAIDGIDRTKGRTAGEALEMLHIADAKIKATTAKVVMSYEHEVANGSSRSFDDPQIERWVIDNDELLKEAVEMGRRSVLNVSQPALSEARATQVATLMLRGGWPSNLAAGYIASVQQGIAAYPEAPTLELSRRLTRAQVAEKRKDRIGTKETLALALKAAGLWVRRLSVSKLNWNSAKESLPDYRPPTDAVEQKAA